MRLGFIDSASIMNAVGALSSHKSYRGWSEWTEQSIIDVTTLLIIHHLLRISPGPSPSLLGSSHSTLYACYDQAYSLLYDVVVDTSQKDAFQKYDVLSARKYFNEWISNNVEDVTCIITKTKQESSYPEWIQWAIKEAWLDHSYRMKGLFNAEMIDSLSLVFEVPSKDMNSLWKKTADLQQVKSWSQGQNLDSDFALARDAYVASAILRGRFHEFISSQEGWHLTHHPIRRHILVPPSKGTEYPTPTPMKDLVKIIVTSAMEEQKPENRVSLWIENLLKMRESYLRGELKQIFYQDQELDKEDSLKIATDTAKELKIRVYPRSLEEQLEAGIGVGVTLGSSLVIFPWSFLIGVSSWYLGKQISVGKWAAEALKLTKGHLRELATSPPGRITRIEKDIKK